MTANESSKERIESLFFEYRRNEAMFQHRVDIELSNSRFAPDELVQDFVHSRLLIDLFSIVDKSIDTMLDHFVLCEEKKKSKLKLLIEHGKVYNYPYFLWYKGWRSDIGTKALASMTLVLQNQAQNLDGIRQGNTIADSKFLNADATLQIFDESFGLRVLISIDRPKC
jgi:hypothetical protein